MQKQLTGLGLTKRQVEVAILLSRLYTKTEVAGRLGVTVTTVKHTLTHIYKRLGARKLLLPGLCRLTVLAILIQRMTGELSLSHGDGSVPLNMILTARELQVAKLVARGYSNKIIAEELGIKSRTVTSHMASIFEKMGFSTRTELAFRVLREFELPEN